MILTFVICSVGALAAGFVDAIAGGGGLITIPALLICGIPPHIALGTNKISASMGTIVSLVTYASNKLVIWRLVIYGLPFSLLGSWLGTLLAVAIDPAILGKILIILLPIAMIVTLLPQKKAVDEELKLEGVKYWVYLPLVCLAIGMYDGFFGPATGSFLILGLHWILGLGLVQSSGTAKAFNLGSNITSAVSFIWIGLLNWPLGLTMGACLMLGNWAGSTFAIRIGASAVRKFLVIVMLLLLATLVVRYVLSYFWPGSFLL